MRMIVAVTALAVTVSACATTPKSFYENPAKVGATALCRAFLETTDPTFKRDAGRELGRRGLSYEACQTKVNVETAAIVGIAAVAAGITVAAACSSGNNCGGGRYLPTDIDCAGGQGNGPQFQYSRMWVGTYDPHDLDRDGDGWGCDANDVAYGG